MSRRSGMHIDVEALTNTPAERAYVVEIQRRIRSGRRQVLARVAGIQGSWAMVLLAGAAIPVVEVVGWPRWVAALLGFAVVIFQGAEQIFGRTSKGFGPLDELRRGLAKELRMLALRAETYSDADDAFAVFIERCEARIAAYDEADIEYYRTLTGRG